MTIGSGSEEPTTTRLWSLTADALVETGISDETMVVATKWGEFDVSGAEQDVRESLRRMGLGPVSLENVVGSGASNPATSVVGLANVLRWLGCSIVHSLGLRDGQGPLLSVVPMVRFPVFEPEMVPEAQRIQLSRFATLRPHEDMLVLEVPGAPFAVSLNQQLATRVVSFLGAPASISAIARKSGIAHHVVADIVAFLVAAGVVLAGEADEPPELAEWAHHELLFHQRDRGRQREALPDSVPEYRPGTPPVVKDAPAGRRFALHRPVVADLAAADPPLTELLESDHGCPEFTLSEIAAERLGELLFRAARIRSLGTVRLGANGRHSASQRPYFNIACCYELELYLSLNRCSGLPRGIYHYDPLEHALTLINESDEDLSDMLDAAKLAATSTRRPSALVTVTARTGRVSWALWGAAYSTTVAHLGAFQQTLHLVAKAMGMSAHAVPIGGNDLVDRSLGLRWPAEVGVGECVLDGFGPR